MQVNTYLYFSGQCEAAFRFYEQCFGGKIEAMLNHGDSPGAEQVPAAWHKAIQHARLNLGGQVLMGSDIPPEYYQKPAGFQVSLDIADAAQAERIFNALAENGSVRMPLQKTFWAARFGMVNDRFDIPWMINCGTFT